MSVCIELQNLSFTYPEQTRKALDDLSFSIEAGQFITLCGPSGCGKSTLLRQFKTVLAPHGTRSGAILLDGRPLDRLDQREQSARIGFVRQDPDAQIVTDKVWHELAFGLESLGLDTPAIRGRVAEMASFFGIQNWFYKDVTELSGGQKQLLNLAAVMAMQPELLILDEPTSQLDPIAASDFLAAIGRIHRELGVTVLLTEHRLEEVFPLSDRVLVMDRGRLAADGAPGEVGEALKNTGSAMFRAMPAAMRIYAAVPSDGERCPVTVRDGRVWLDGFARKHPLFPVPPENVPPSPPEKTVEADGVWFKYGKDLPDVVKGLSLRVGRGEFLAILGGNGAGKTTALSLLAGLRRPYRGTVRVTGTVGVLPQNPQSLFVKKTVREDLFEILKGRDGSSAEKEKAAASAVRLCRLEDFLDRHPYDLSGGEQQRAALAKVLLLKPQVLLLDEPTKGLDAEFKQILASILATLLRRGVSVVMVSHDLEFCAEHAHRCALFFDGNIVSSGTPREFFSGSSFYTTAANRIARGVLPDAVTAEDVIAGCGGTVPPHPPLPPDGDPLPPEPDVKPVRHGLPLRRKIWACIAGTGVALSFLCAVGLIRPAWLSGSVYRPYLLLIAALFLLAPAVGDRGKETAAPPRSPETRRRFSRRTTVAALMILLLIPLTIFVGMFYFGDRKYYFISLLVLLECMVPFFLLFEGRKPQAREIVILAVLCALGVAGRAAFFMLPQFKPVMAIVILSGVAFGAESGFLVGAGTMLLSNMFFGQGPWTPWQMFAMGLIGFLAGILFRRGLLRRGRLSLAVFGALAAVFIFGGIMNPASALMWSHTLNWKILLTYYLSGLPMDLIQAAATAFFLWFLSQPMLEKLDRVKIKYGLVEE